MNTIFDSWNVSPEELTQLISANPSLRGFMFGYISEFRVREFLSNCNGVSNVKKYDDHDRSHKGDISFIYNYREIKMEVKALQTNSIQDYGDGKWEGVFQCDASDRREVPLPNGNTVETTCLVIGEFDLLAVNLFAFGNEWRFAFAKNSDLPHPRAYRNINEDDAQYLIKSSIKITWPLQFPFTQDIFAVMNSL